MRRKKFEKSRVFHQIYIYIFTYIFVAVQDFREIMKKLSRKVAIKASCTECQALVRTLFA